VTPKQRWLIGDNCTARGWGSAGSGDRYYTPTYKKRLIQRFALISVKKGWHLFAIFFLSFSDLRRKW
jgi:hypothetical protein